MTKLRGNLSGYSRASPDSAAVPHANHRGYPEDHGVVLVEYAGLWRVKPA